ncbi:MAG: DEAD/DEAH box helicase [Planctomycetota bacterium]
MTDHAPIRFDDLNLDPKLLGTLASKGYTNPTPIQAQSIPPVLEGRDLLGCAQTGTGKTAAFSLPMLHRLIAPRPGGRPRGPRRARALVLAPTRELAGQIEESLKTYGRGTGLRGAVVYGGVKQFHQVRQLRAGLDVIVATPGRLLDLMEQGHVDLSCIEMFVLDEADRMLDMGFIHPIRKIAAELPEAHQTLLFSATMPPKIRQLADAMLTDPVSVSVTPVASAAPTIDQSIYHLPQTHKLTLLGHLLQDEGFARTVVFTRTKFGAERLAKRLKGEGIAADAIHGNKTQGQRQRALDAFRSDRLRVLVATDVAARGLDVDGVSHVVNFDLPEEPESYVHRIGRTGRAGATGQAISFCSRDEHGLLLGIERLTGKKIEVESAPDELGIPDHPMPHRGQPSGTSRGKTGRRPSGKHGKRRAARPSSPSSSPGSARSSDDRSAQRGGGSGKGGSESRVKTGSKPRTKARGKNGNGGGTSGGYGPKSRGGSNAGPKRGRRPVGSRPAQG